MMSEEALHSVANIFWELGKAIFPRGSVKDVYAWFRSSARNKYASIAWVMKPEALERVLGVSDEERQGQLPFSGPYLDGMLRRAGIGYDAFRYDRAVHVFDFLSHMSNLARDLVDEDSIEDWFITFIPEPGYPWPHSYYSAKTGRVSKAPRPEWLLDTTVLDTSTQTQSPGVNLCRLIPPPPSWHERGAEIASFGRDFFLVTHAMGTLADLTRQGSWKDNAKSINDCGGLLFPSLAIGALPATNIGPFVLVADVGLVLSSIGPHRPTRARPLLHVFDTDVWSMTTRSFFEDGALSAFQQLTGLSDYMSTFDLTVWPIGPPPAPWLHGPGVASPVDRLPALKREVRARTRVWEKAVDIDSLTAIEERVAQTKAHYGYLEAKANVVLPIAQFSMAAGPTGRSGGFKSFLKATGFQGRFVDVELPDPIRALMSDDDRETTTFFPEWQGLPWERRQAMRRLAELQYASHVSAAILAAGRRVEV